MLVRFADPSLARCFSDRSNAIRRWGVDVAEQYARVINFLECVERPTDLAKFAFLGATMEQTSQEPLWTVQLDKNWRLTLEPDEGGKYFIVAGVVHYRD